MGKMIERLIVSQYIKKNYTCETNFLFEIKTEIVHQHYHKGKAMDLHTTLDREEEIRKNLISVFKDNELDLKFVSFS